MTILKRNLIHQALMLHGNISPCGSRAALDDCFTEDFGQIMFWFNTCDNSTHMVSAPSQNAESIPDMAQ